MLHFSCATLDETSGDKSQRPDAFHLFADEFERGLIAVGSVNTI